MGKLFDDAHGDSDFRLQTSDSSLVLLRSEG
jgi:hypothetical protein